MNELWSSRLGFLLASVGAAVGIGNIWRFSAVVGQNGGGAYLVPYFISVVALAVPLMMLELSAGRAHRGSIVAAFSTVHRRLAAGGWLVNAMVFGILSYYLVITGWTLGYLVISLSDAGTTFADFTGGWLPLAYFVVVALITGVVVASGVRNGIERLTTYVMPLAFLILVFLAVYAITLDGFGDGMDFLFTPDFSVLDDPSIWSAAIGQAFFSLSVGFGVLLAYGSYLDKKTDIATSSWIIATMDLSVALLAGVVIFPIVFTHGLEPTLGAELAFTTLPTAFEVMTAGQLVAIAFFLLIFLAALTSAVSMLEANVGAVMEATGLGRRITTAIMTLAIIALGLPAALSYSAADLTVGGTRILDFMDDTLGTIGLPLGALIIAVVFAWWGRDHVLEAEIARGRTGRVVRSLIFLTRWLIPPVLITIVAARFVTAGGFEGWHILPDAPVVGRLARDLGLLIMLPLLLAAMLALVAFLRRRIAGPIAVGTSDEPSVDASSGQE